MAVEGDKEPKAEEGKSKLTFARPPGLRQSHVAQAKPGAESRSGRSKV